MIDTVKIALDNLEFDRLLEHENLEHEISVLTRIAKAQIVSRVAEINAEQPAELLTLEQVTETHIRRVLCQVKKIGDAALILGVDEATLWRKRKKFGLSV